VASFLVRRFLAAGEEIWLLLLSRALVLTLTIDSLLSFRGE
jgi:hypothetical protein